MKRSEFIALFVITAFLLVLAIGLFYVSNNFPKVFDVERAQQAYENSITSPRALSAEEVTTFIGLSVKADKAGQEMMRDLLNAVKWLGFILLTLVFNMCLLIISIYRREKHENC